MKVLISLAVLLITIEAKATLATHGMVIFGKENLHAYHLPMFHKVHNKQMVLTFDVPAAVKEQIIKLEDTEFLTFVPAPFDLDQFIKAPFELTGDLYSGHFEKDGIVVMSGITLAHPKIEYLQTLVQPANSIENYQIFGTKTDTYALHLIDGGTSIDQIFKLTTLNASDFETAINYHHLSSNHFLELKANYTISTPAGHCPSRLCGEPGYDLASFKVDSLYFSDEVM